MPLEISEHNRKSDRILVLKPIDGKPRTTMGLTDTGLFTGDNELHAIMDQVTCLWHMRYKNGITPLVLKGQFTSFDKLYRYAETYFKKRNIDIIEVLD